MRVPLALLRASLMVALQYRGDFVFELFTGVIRTIGRVLPLLLVYGHTTSISGWTADEAMLVMGFFLLMTAFHEGLMEPNLGEVVEAVRQGTLDLWLLKPADAQLFVSIRRVDPAYAWDVFAAFAVIGIASWRVGLPSPLDVVVAFVLLACGLCAMYGLWLLAITTSFWFVRVDNLRFLLLSVADAGRWPLGVFTGWVKLLFVAVVPVALVTTFPAEALRGTWGWPLVAIAVSVALAFLIGSRLAWVRALRSYTSASS
jgi:ABC-2 type transport system permease protein